MIIRCNCCEYLSDDIQDMEGHIKNQHGTSSHSVVVAGINKHREAVREIMLQLGRVIARRSWDHDASKLEPDELPAYEKYVPLLEAATTAEEFNRLMAEFKPTRDLRRFLATRVRKSKVSLLMNLSSLKTVLRKHWLYRGLLSMEKLFGKRQ